MTYYLRSFTSPNDTPEAVKQAPNICLLHHTYLVCVLYILLILTLKYQFSLLRQVKETVDVISDVSLVLTDAIPEPGFLLMESFGLEGASTIANSSYPTKSTLKDISSMYFLAAFTTCIIEC